MRTENKTKTEKVILKIISPGKSNERARPRAEVLMAAGDPGTPKCTTITPRNHIECEHGGPWPRTTRCRYGRPRSRLTRKTTPLMNYAAIRTRTWELKMGPGGLFEPSANPAGDAIEIEMKLLCVKVVMPSWFRIGNQVRGYFRAPQELSAAGARS